MRGRRSTASTSIGPPPPFRPRALSRPGLAPPVLLPADLPGPRLGPPVLPRPGAPHGPFLPARRWRSAPTRHFPASQ
eukprot:3817712-Lingulodinium_polyedra.AAC.1